MRDVKLSGPIAMETTRSWWVTFLFNIIIHSIHGLLHDSEPDLMEFEIAASQVNKQGFCDNVHTTLG